MVNIFSLIDRTLISKEVLQMLTRLCTIGEIPVLKYMRNVEVNHFTRII